MDLVAGAQGPPCSDRRMRMRRIVIDDELDVQIGGHAGVEVA